MKRFVSLTAVCLLLGSMAPTSASAAPDQCAEKILSRGGGFTTIELPNGISSVPAPWKEPRAMYYAVAAGNPNRIFSSGDTSIQRSDDGGCTWKEVFHIPTLIGGTPTIACDGSLRVLSAALAPGCARIIDIDVGTTEKTANKVFVSVSTYWAGTLLAFPWLQGPWTTWTFVSEDGGDTFNLLLDPSTPEGATVSKGVGWMEIAPSDGDTIYLFRSDQNYGFVPDLFVSRDGGKTWAKRPSLGIAFKEFTINPEDAGDLWTLAENLNAGQQPLAWQLLRSRDYGQTWAPVPAAFDVSDIQSLAVKSDARGVHAAVHLQRAQKNMYMSPEGGWSELPPSNSGYVVFGNTPRYIFFIDTAQYVSRWDSKRKVVSGIKGTIYGNHADQVLPSYRPNAGLYFLADCFQMDAGTLTADTSCALLTRYTGRGS